MSAGACIPPRAGCPPPCTTSATCRPSSSGRLPAPSWWSTGANQYAGRYTLGHFDLPMRNCTIALDGTVVVKNGVLQGNWRPDASGDKNMSDIADYYDLTRIRPEVQKVLRRVNELGREKFAGRAKAVDDDASFPVDNYRDLAGRRLPRPLHPRGIRRLGLSMFEHAMVGAEIGNIAAPPR